MIKGSSPQSDSSEMALIAALRSAELGCRLWFEWVHTAQNPADPLSRLGLEDPGVQQQLRTGSWLALQPSVNWDQVLCTPTDLVRRWG